MFTEYSGKKIHYQKRGKGDNTLVLLHGFTENLHIWDFIAEELSRDVEVITVDLPGHGKTDNFSDIHTMEFMADTVKAVLDQEGIDLCTMTGHSMGGYVTLAFASQYANRLRGMGLFHSTAAADTPEAKQNRDRLIKVIAQDKAGFVNSFIPSLFAPENVQTFNQEIKRMIELSNATSTQGIIAALRGMKEREDHVDLLGELPFPVLFILGKKDSRIPYNNMWRQIALPGKSCLLLLENAGHMGFIEAKAETAEMMKSFVSFSNIR